MSNRIRKAFVTVGAFAVFAASNSWAEKSETKLSVSEAKLQARFAAEDLKDTIKAQEEIIALKPELRELAIMCAAGLLSSKLAEWGQHEIEKGNKTRKQLMYIGGISMIKLATLTQAANLNDASACHMKEAMILIAMSKGEQQEPANCRQKAYGTERQVNAVKELYRPEMKDIQKLINRWATSVSLLSNSSAKLDNYGEH